MAFRRRKQVISFSLSPDTIGTLEQISNDQQISMSALVDDVLSKNLNAIKWNPIETTEDDRVPFQEIDTTMPATVAELRKRQSSCRMSCELLLMYIEQNKPITENSIYNAAIFSIALVASIDPDDTIFIETSLMRLKPCGVLGTPSLKREIRIKMRQFSAIHLRAFELENVHE
jgi:hypothetical protein